jgi:hypothetical protein
MAANAAKPNLGDDELQMIWRNLAGLKFKKCLPFVEIEPAPSMITRRCSTMSSAFARSRRSPARQACSWHSIQLKTPARAS